MMVLRQLRKLGIPLAVLSVLIAAPNRVGATTITFTGVPPGSYATYAEAGMEFSDFVPAGQTFEIIPFGSEQQIRKVGGFGGGVWFRLADGSPFILDSLIGGGGGNFNVLFTGFDVNGGMHNVAASGGFIAFPQPDWSQIVEVDMQVTAFISGGVGTIADVVFDRAAVTNPVPEPVTLLLLGSGGAVLATRARRRSAEDRRV